MKHTCSICKKTETCKKEKCDFIILLGFHASCRATQLLKEEKIKELNSDKGNLFDIDEVIHLSEEWIKLNEWRDGETGEMEAYYNGRAEGVKFVLHLLKRCGD